MSFFIFCLIICVIVFFKVWVDVLGYEVWILIVGGVIDGYCVIGKFLIVKIFVSIIMIVSIYVNMGWLIKNCDIKFFCYWLLVIDFVGIVFIGVFGWIFCKFLIISLLLLFRLFVIN